jgi:hypothetical protein
MNRKLYLQKILDTALKGRVTEMFGKNSYIKITNLIYVRSKDCYTINAVLHLDDLETDSELIQEGAPLIIKQGWSVVGDKKPIMVNFSLDTPE